jgi:H+/Cl- antiporter ClcA
MSEDAKPTNAGLPFARQRDFWRLMGYGVVLGVGPGLGALLFLGVVNGLTELIWPEDPDPSFLGGELWWIGAAAAAGLVVGVLRKALRMPESQPGIFGMLEKEHVDYRQVPKTVLVSIVSLVGGSSLGPSFAQGSIGGGLGTWLSERRRLPPELERTNTLSGASGSLGALLGAPFLGSLLVVETARPSAARFINVFVPATVAATIGFAIVFLVSGTQFFDLFEVEGYELEGWHLLVAIPLGLLGAVLTVAIALTIKLLSRLTAPLQGSLLLPVLGGAGFGLVGLLLPLTMFAGSAQLPVAIDEDAELGIGLLVAVLLAKIFSFGLSHATGFIGGSVVPSIFIGGTAGIVVHLVFPDIPKALAIACLLAAVPGAAVQIPFTLIGFAALAVGLGAVETAPVGVAVLTAYVAVAGLGLLQPHGKRHGDVVGMTKPPTDDA